MWISWTLGLQSIAQTSSNKQVCRMIQVDQFFNEPVPNSSGIVPMACSFRVDIVVSATTLVGYAMI